MNDESDNLTPAEVDAWLRAAGEGPTSEDADASLDAACARDLAWLEGTLDAATLEERPLRTAATVALLRRKLTERAVAPVPTPSAQLFPNIPRWALTSGVAAAAVVGAVLFYGLREEPNQLPQASNAGGMGSYGEVISPVREPDSVQSRAEWAFGLTDRLGRGDDLLVSVSPDDLLAMTGPDLDAEFQDLAVNDMVGQWSELYR